MSDKYWIEYQAKKAVYTNLNYQTFLESGLQDKDKLISAKDKTIAELLQKYEYPLRETAYMRVPVEVWEQREAELSTLRESMRWIPVSERLPEPDVEIFAQWNDGVLGIPTTEYFRDHPDQFICWMPLPSLPQPPESGNG